MVQAVPILRAGLCGIVPAEMGRRFQRRHYNEIESAVVVIIKERNPRPHSSSDIF